MSGKRKNTTTVKLQNKQLNKQASNREEKLKNEANEYVMITAGDPRPGGEGTVPRRQGGAGGAPRDY